MAQPYEAFTDVVNGIDPGRDNVAGTADDGVVQVWSVPRTYPGFGQIQRADRQRGPGEGDDRYTAFETTFSKSYSNGWSLLGSYSIDKRDVKNIDAAQPERGLGTYNWALGTAGDVPGRALERHLRAALADAGGVDVHRAAGRVLQSRRPGARCARTRWST